MCLCVCFYPLQCSVDCGVGRRTRSVRCVSDQGSIVSDMECNSRARPQGSEECNMGPCVTNWYFTTWSNTVSNTHTQKWRKKRSQHLTVILNMIFHFVLSVFSAVWPRGAEEGGGVSDSRRGQGWWRRRGLCCGKTGRDEGLQQRSVCANIHVVQQPLVTGRTEAVKDKWNTETKGGNSTQQL